MKLAIVTGGAHGIGKSISMKLLDDGYQVVLLDVSSDFIEKLKGELNNKRLHAIVCDVGNPEEVYQVIQDIGQQYGKIDCLVNNAGISRFKSIEEMTVEEWNRIISVNLSSIFYMVKYVKPYFSDRSAIVNISSTRALMSEPDGEAYGASKGGIFSLSHALAISLGPKTRVNCISPGWIEVNDDVVLSPEDHSQHPAGRVGKANDIAEMVAYLLSEKAGFITGQNFVIDGGMTRKMIYV
ncbi:MAG: SDR family oxidoreductase [Bacteroidales bacterium]|nr:SDR family oxidoreductase [Bacteroidales bacterium]